MRAGGNGEHAFARGGNAYNAYHIVNGDIKPTGPYHAILNIVNMHGMIAALHVFEAEFAEAGAHRAPVARGYFNYLNLQSVARHCALNEQGACGGVMHAVYLEPLALPRDGAIVAIQRFKQHRVPAFAARGRGVLRVHNVYLFIRCEPEHEKYTSFPKIIYNYKPENGGLSMGFGVERVLWTSKRNGERAGTGRITNGSE